MQEEIKNYYLFPNAIPSPFSTSCHMDPNKTFSPLRLGLIYRKALFCQLYSSGYKHHNHTQEVNDILKTCC